MIASSLRRVSVMRSAASGWRLPGLAALCLVLMSCWAHASAERAAGIEPELARPFEAEFTPVFTPWRPDRLPALTLPTLDDGRAGLDGQADRLVLVHFFATWCEPCRPELTSLEKLRRELDPHAFAILAVDVGEPADRVRRFFQDLTVGYRVLLDVDKTALRAWGVDVLPTTFVIDRDGCPLWRIEGDLDWSAPSTLERVRARLGSPRPSRQAAARLGDQNLRNCISNGDQP